MIKKTVLVFIAAIALLAGCKKNNPSPAVAIIGKWYYSSIRVQTFLGNTPPVTDLVSDTTYTVLNGEFIQFNSDGTGLTYVSTRNTPDMDLTWSVTGNQETETDANIGVPMVYTININGSTMTRHIEYGLLNGYTYIDDDVMHK